MTIGLAWIAIAIFARTSLRTWWAPGALMSLLFAVDAIGTASLAPEYPNSFSANLLLQVLVLALIVGGIAGQSLGGDQPLSASFALPRVGGLIAVGYISSIASLIATLGVVGATPGTLLSWSNLSTVAQQSTKLRYTVGFDFPLYYNLSNAVTLAYAMLVSMHWVQSRRVSKSLLGPLVIYCLTNLLITTRAPILFMLILMIFSAIWAERSLSHKASFPPLFSPKHAKKLITAGAGVAGLFFFFQVVRFGQNHAQPAGEVWQHLRRYPWGSLPGFSLWREGLAGATPPHPPGYYTFMGIFDNLGIEERTEGGFADYVDLASGEPGNVYTAFRGLILDFGIGGAALFMLAVGFIAGLAMWTSYFPPRASVSIYIGVSSFVTWSLIFSFWSYTSNIAALIILPLLHRYLARNATSHPLLNADSDG